MAEKQTLKAKSKAESLVRLVIYTAIIIVLLYISSFLKFRIDLTTDNKYSLSPVSKDILKNLDDIVFVQVYLDGDIPYEFKRLSQSIKDLLDDFRGYSNGSIDYEFINPDEEGEEEAKKEFFTSLYKRGLKPMNIEIKKDDGSRSEKLIFPGAIVHYKNREIPVSLVRNNPGLHAEQNLNLSTQMLEYEFINSIKILSDTLLRKIAFLEGQKELEEIYVADITHAMANYFQVDRGAINGQLNCLDAYEAVIIAKPQAKFNEKNKFILDQYLMQGGKLIWFIDAVQVSLDSLFEGNTLAIPMDLNVNDQLFKYGVRINPNLIKDIQCSMIPVNTALQGNKPKFVRAPWLYYPLISGGMVQHPVTKGLNMISTKFPSVLDTVSSSPGVNKTFLLRTSMFTDVIKVPAMISLEDVKEQPKRESFNKPNQPIAVLLEGKFESVFKNRPLGKMFPGKNINFLKESQPTSMLVVADGDMIKNDVKQTPRGAMFSPLGMDKYTQQMYGNKEFIINVLNYMTDETGLIELRAREFKLRLLNKAKIKNERTKWQIINTAIPVLVIILSGIFLHFFRKRKYTG